MIESLTESGLPLAANTQRYTKPLDFTDRRSFLVQIYPVRGNYGLVELHSESMVIGRDPSCELPIVDNAVSRRHAVIECASDGFRVVDLGSTNGTFVNDVRVPERILSAGDRIRIGSHIFKFLADDQIEAQYHECVYSMATRDGLTAAFNQRYLADALDREVNSARRQLRPMALVMIDVDHFKAINDAFGHLAGDEVLIGLCNRLRDSLRRAEILARYGGEEFAILLTETTLEEARVLAERIRGAVAGAPISTTHGEIAATISVGIAATPAGESTTASDVLARADRNLYAAKAAGRNCVVG